MKLVYTIKKSDIGKGQLNSDKTCKCCGTLLWAQSINCMEFMGKVQPQDVGKRIYFSFGSYQVENQEQLKSRIEARV